MRDVTPDVVTNEPRITRLWVIAVDDALIPQEPASIKAARQIVRDLIDKFGPDDLVAIVFTADSRQAQDFTQDRTKLLATLDRFKPGLAYWKNPTLGTVGAAAVTVDMSAEFRRQDPQFWLGSAETIRNIVESLGALPQSRKALIWITPGAPINVFATITDEVSLRLKDIKTGIFAVAKRANVPIYPIDPTGLLGLKLFITGGDLTAADCPPIGPCRPWVLAMDDIMATAANTGGHAIVNTNDFTQGIASIVEENRSYYLIGYRPTNTVADGTLRRLDVRANRQGVDVRTRSSYEAPKPGAGPPKNANETLARATAGLIPIRELPLRAAVAPFAIPGGRNAAVTIALGVTQPVPAQAATGRMTVTTELRTAAYTTEGASKAAQRQTATVTLRAGSSGDAHYEALSRIDLPPGRYRLRLAAYHVNADKTGTVMVDVIVPDFNRDKVSLSGVVLGATPGLPSAPRDLFKSILPFVPTAQRAFGTSDRVTALVDLYQSTTTVVPARLAIRITDTSGAVLIDEAHVIGAERFVAAEATTPTRPARAEFPGSPQTTPDPFANKGLRAAEYQYALPVGRLPAGEYLLTFDVTAGDTTLRRDVQFSVK